MMLYEFLDESAGKRVDRDFPMGGAPGIGEYIRNTKLRRLPPTLGAPAVDNLVLASNHFACYQGCEFIKDGRKLHPVEIVKMRKDWSRLIRSGQVRPVKGPKSAEHYDRYGRPVLRGKDRIREFANRNGFEWGGG